MKEATLRQLMLDRTPFPDGFAPAYCTKSAAEGFDGIWHVHDSEPTFQSGEWHSRGQVYEIGIDPSDSLDHTPEFTIGMGPEDSIFRIVLVDQK